MVCTPRQQNFRLVLIINHWHQHSGELDHLLQVRCAFGELLELQRCRHRSTVRWLSVVLGRGHGTVHRPRLQVLAKFPDYPKIKKEILDKGLESLFRASDEKEIAAFFRLGAIEV